MRTRPEPPLGVHCLLDLEGVASGLLADAEALETALVGAAERGGARVVGRHFHRFAPQGTSGVVILAESHLAIHTWPERGFAAVDVFTCGDPGDAEGDIAGRIVDEVIAALAPARHAVRRLERGRRTVTPSELAAL